MSVSILLPEGGEWGDAATRRIRAEAETTTTLFGKFGQPEIYSIHWRKSS
jgi:hypothetical protein